MGSFLDALQSPSFSGNFLAAGTFVVAIALAVIQIVSIILTQIFGIKQLQLGIGFILLGVAAITIMLVSLALGARDLSFGTILVGIFLAGIVTFMIMYLPSLVPTIFQASVLNMKVTAMSILPLP